jgi:hypothetical protein
MSEQHPERHSGAGARHGVEPAYAPGSDHDEDLQSSTPGSTGPQRASGGSQPAEDAGMGVSSERVGHTGPGQRATDGLRDVAPHERGAEDEIAPDRLRGEPEPKPVGLPPKADPPRLDPRS